MRILPDSLLRIPVSTKYSCTLPIKEEEVYVQGRGRESVQEYFVLTGIRNNESGKILILRTC